MNRVTKDLIDSYDVLGLEFTMNLEDVRKRYKKLGE